MIHGSSNDPVLIKRITLKIWTLRDEVESVITKVITSKGDEKKLSPEEIQRIKNEYSYSGPADQRPGLTLIQGGGGAPASAEGEQSGDDLEAEMAAAMGGGGEAEQSGEDLEAEMAAAMGGDGEAEQSGEDLEAEMAAAMGGDAEGEDGEEDLEAAMAAAMGGDAPAEAAAPAPATASSDKKAIIQRGSQNISPTKISRGVTILSEVSMEKLYFFSERNFTEGQSIVIEFQIPKRFVLNAKVHYCRPFNIGSRIISNKKVDYRTVAEFSFLKEGERTLLREFIQSIEPDIPEPPPAAPKNNDDDDGDAFDGLDDLGL